MIKIIHTFVLFPLLFLFIFPPDCKAQSDSPCFFNNRHCKYLYQTNLQRFSSHDRQIASSEHPNIFTCPAGFRILDFDLTIEDGAKLLGVLVSDDRRTFLEIRDLNTGHQQLIKNMTIYHPWKILFADADNDWVTEVCLGVEKTTPLHPISAKRLFIYDFHHGLQPKWRGSRLAHPFTDFGFVPENNRTMLVALEADRNKRPQLNTYEWDSFGFTAIPIKIAGPVPLMDALNQGYVLRNGIYRRALFGMHHDRVLRVIGG